ncbi:Protein OBERON 3, partial [Mucuna pruriens]
MIGGKDLVPNGVNSEVENSRSTVQQKHHDIVHGKEHSQEKNPEKKVGVNEFQSTPTKLGTSGLQELTLSYLCDNPKLGLVEREVGDRSLVKGKEIVVFGNSDQDEKHQLCLNLSEGTSLSERDELRFEFSLGGVKQCLEQDYLRRRIPIGNQNKDQDEKWIERDFLSLSESRENSSKRSIEEECEREKNSDNKKQKLETLSLSLALPDVSISLTASNAMQNGDQLVRPKPSKPSTRTTTTVNSCSNDYTAASLSHSCSHPFSHNPSCSRTRNSTENFEYSVSKDDQIWHCGEGTNGSVHSRFKPIGDGVALANHSFMQGNSQYKATSSDNQSFYPSELPARVRFEAPSEGSRGKNSENLRGLEGVDGEKVMKFSTSSERVLREIVTESVPAMALTFQEFTDEAITSIKEHLKGLIEMPEKKVELLSLQTRLGQRSDLTRETLSKCHKEQLQILVAIKMGLGSVLSGQFQFVEMVEVFLYMRCRNVNCKNLLPVDDCECKMCSGSKGFCSSCMCPVCLNFDCASNTCSWVGCDVCFHWCHVACAIQRNLIKPGPSLKGPSGTSEVQFHCTGCGHASEMFGFVKDVFVFCAKDWGLETLVKELDCVRRIFLESEDRKGKELHIKTNDMLLKLQSKLLSPLDACNYIIQFFSLFIKTITFRQYDVDNMPEFPASAISSKDLSTSKAKLTVDTTPSLPQSTSLIPKHSHDMSYTRSHNLQQKDLKASLFSEHKNETDFHLDALLRKGGHESLESIVRIKEAEARMFQRKADEARREAEGFQKMIKTKTAQMEEEDAERLGKLCLHETEERRKRKFEELSVLQNSHYDYFNMKSRMQDEIHGLLKRMEVTKQQWY